MATARHPTDLSARDDGRAEARDLAPCDVFSSYRPFGELRLRRPAALAMRDMVAEMTAATGIAVAYGTSDGRGLAITFADCQTERSRGWLDANAARFGFERVGPTSRWRWLADAVPETVQQPG